MSSGGAPAPQPKHPDAAGHSPSQFAWALANTTVWTPRFRSASLGVTEQCTIHDSQCTMIRQRSLSVTLSGAEGGAKGSTQRNIHRCSSKRFTPARSSRRSELLPSRFAWVHAHPTAEIPRFRFATLGMTEQCTIHNYSARSCCHVERRGARPAVETSRRCETFAITIRAGSR